MATTFREIYNRALFRFADHKFLEYDVEIKEAVLERYLISAKTEFEDICRVNLNDYNKETKQFNQDLDDKIIEILSLGIAYYWLSFKTLDSELVKNVLNSRDYYYYSPGNLLKEVQTLRETVRNEFYSAMREYSYSQQNWSGLTPKGGGQ